MDREWTREETREGGEQAWMENIEEGEGAERDGGREGGRKGGKRLETHTTWRARARQGWAPPRAASTCEDSQANLGPLAQPRPTVKSWQGKGKRGKVWKGGLKERRRRASQSIERFLSFLSISAPHHPYPLDFSLLLPLSCQPLPQACAGPCRWPPKSPC